MPERPNILFVTAEYICLRPGCYNDPNALTPILDSSAALILRAGAVLVR